MVTSSMESNDITDEVTVGSDPRPRFLFGRGAILALCIPNYGDSGRKSA